MNPSWKAFLIENGAEFKDNGENETLLSFTQSKSQSTSNASQLTSLSDHGLIEVHGEDAESFLQNQLTNDIRNITENNHQQNAWCSPKGRIIANFTIFKRSDRFYLILSHDLIDLVLKKLRMYVMMSKVTIEDVSGSLVYFSYSGEHAESELQEIGLNVPTQVGLHSKNEDNSLSILRVAGAVARFELIAELDDAKKLWAQCAEKATSVGINAWHYQNIIAGTPFITLASSESWIPQMVNYIAVGGVDFKKGCYPGQEVVARLNYLGKTKRRLYHVLFDTDELLNIGADIASDNDAKAGEILNIALNPDGKAEALVILKIAQASSSLWLASNDRVSLTLLDLPYPIEDE